MAIIRKFKIQPMGRDTRHSDCTGCIRAVESSGEKFIQIDTYGSADREMPGKVSQSLRLPVEAVNQILQMAKNHF